MNGLLVENLEQMFYIYNTLKNNYWLPEYDATDIVRKKVYEEIKEWLKNQAFKKGIILSKKWEETDKVIYVENKWQNCYLWLSFDVFIIREEVKDELERVFWKSLGEYVEFLDLKLVDLETIEEITDIWKWYWINILKVIEWICEKDYEKKWKRYSPVIYKHKIWDNKYPIFRLKERRSSPVISNEFKEILEKYQQNEDLKIYNFSGVPYIEDLESE